MKWIVILILCLAVGILNIMAAINFFQGNSGNALTYILFAAIIFGGIMIYAYVKKL